MTATASKSWLTLAETINRDYTPTFSHNETQAAEVAERGDYIVPADEEVAELARRLYSGPDSFDRDAIRESAEAAVYEACDKLHRREVYKVCDRLDREAEDEMLAKMDAVRAMAEAVSDALGEDMRQAGGGSYYLTFRGLKLRVSDHAQKPGGGWSETRGERMGESDLQWVVARESDVPSREAIRNRVARKLWESR